MRYPLFTLLFCFFSLQCFSQDGFPRKYGFTDSTLNYVNAFDQDESGNIYVVSTSETQLHGNLMKLDSKGDLVFNKRIDFTTANGTHWQSQLENVYCTQDNGVVVMGNFSDNVVVIIKFDEVGQMLWKKSFKHSGNVAQPLFEEDLASNGYFGFYDNNDMTINKLDANGVLLWSKRLNDNQTNLKANSMSRVSDTTFLIVGSSNQGTSTFGNLTTIDFDGNVIRTIRFPNHLNGASSALIDTTLYVSSPFIPAMILFGDQQTDSAKGFEVDYTLEFFSPFRIQQELITYRDSLVLRPQSIYNSDSRIDIYDPANDERYGLLVSGELVSVLERPSGGLLLLKNTSDFDMGAADRPYFFEIDTLPANLELKKSGFVEGNNCSSFDSISTPLSYEFELSASVPNSYTVMPEDTLLGVNILSELMLSQQSCTVQLSIPEVNEELGFVLYPNPVEDRLNIQFSANANGQITVFTIDGRQIVNEAITGQEMSLPVNEFPSGIYFVTVNSDLGSSTATFKKN